MTRPPKDETATPIIKPLETEGIDGKLGSTNSRRARLCDEIGGAALFGYSPDSELIAVGDRLAAAEVNLDHLFAVDGATGFVR